MICKNCGGTFAEDATKCPYCGSMHLAGATAAYHQKFEDMTDDLAALGDNHVDIYKKMMRHQGRRTLIYIAIAVAIICGFLGLWFASAKAESALNEANAAEAKARLAWQAETYTMLDGLYSTGEFDAIIAFEDALFADNPNNYSLYYWSHCDFLDAYRDYTEFIAAQQMYETTGEADTVAFASTLRFYLAYYEAPYYVSFTESDLVLVQGYVAEMGDFLQEVLGLTEDELLALHDSMAEDDGWVSFANCYDYIEAAFT